MSSFSIGARRLTPTPPFPLTPRSQSNESPEPVPPADPLDISQKADAIISRLTATATAASAAKDADQSDIQKKADDIISRLEAKANANQQDSVQDLIRKVEQSHSQYSVPPNMAHLRPGMLMPGMPGMMLVPIPFSGGPYGMMPPRPPFGGNMGWRPPTPVKGPMIPMPVMAAPLRPPNSPMPQLASAASTVARPPPSAMSLSLPARPNGLSLPVPASSPLWNAHASSSYTPRYRPPTETPPIPSSSPTIRSAKPTESYRPASKPAPSIPSTPGLVARSAQVLSADRKSPTTQIIPSPATSRPTSAAPDHFRSEDKGSPPRLVASLKSPDPSPDGPSQQSDRQPNPENQIFLGSLTPSATLPLLRQAFSSISPILSIELRTPLAMIEFEQPEAVDRAVSKFDGSWFAGAKIRVERAVEKCEEKRSGRDKKEGSRKRSSDANDEGRGKRSR